MLGRLLDLWPYWLPVSLVVAHAMRCRWAGRKFEAVLFLSLSRWFLWPHVGLVKDRGETDRTWLFYLVELRWLFVHLMVGPLWWAKPVERPAPLVAGHRKRVT